MYNTKIAKNGQNWRKPEEQLCLDIPSNYIGMGA